MGRLSEVDILAAIYLHCKNVNMAQLETMIPIHFGPLPPNMFCGTFTWSMEDGRNMGHVINMYFHVPQGKLVDGDSINKAVKSNRGLVTEMSMHHSNVGGGHCGFFCNNYKHGNKMTWCYYVTEQGQIPKQLLDKTKKWYHEIDSSKTLLDKRLFCCNK